MNILIIEDDKASSELLLKILSKYGICDIAINGIEAVDAFILAHDEASPYDLIFLDLMLPLLDGENVLSIIRKIEGERKVPNRVRVLITSALNDPELTARLTGYGFDTYFIKPIDAIQIDSFVKSVQAGQA